MTAKRAAGLLLLAAFLWGAGNIANKTVLTHVGPITTVSLRCFLAAIVILPLALRERQWDRSRDWLHSAVGVSLWFAAAIVLQQAGFGLTSVTNAGFLINTASVMTPLLIWFLWSERPGRRLALAAGLTCLGAFLMAGGATGMTRFNLGDVLCLLSAAFYAGWMVALGQHARRHGRPFSTSLVQFSATALIVSPAAVWMEHPALTSVRAAAPELVLLGVFSTAAAFVLQSHAQKYLTASTAAVIVSAESLFGALGAFVLLAERTPVTGVAGAGLITLAILLAATDKQSVPRSSRSIVRPWVQVR